jgi:hypothetical protein
MRIKRSRSSNRRTLYSANRSRSSVNVSRC